MEFVDLGAVPSLNGGSRVRRRPPNGKGKDVRADDGFHLNQNGAEILALDIAELVTADLRARGAQV